MTKEQLYEVIGDINEKHIKEAENTMKTNKKNTWVKWGAMAACMCLIIGGAAILNNHRADSESPNTGDELSTIDNYSGELTPNINAGAVTESTERSGDYAPMLTIDGITYIDTYEKYAEEIAESSVQRSTSYVDGYPKNNGEQNFDRTNVDYVLIDNSTVICLIDGEWRIFHALNTSGPQQEPSVPTEGMDAPVDENTYSEARTYSAEILDLQDRISAAMTNHELPFVSTSAILENPDRVHVTCATTDEELIHLLKSYDTTGKLLEIEFVTSAAATEDYAISYR